MATPVHKCWIRLGRYGSPANTMHAEFICTLGGTHDVYRIVGGRWDKSRQTYVYTHELSVRWDSKKQYTVRVYLHAQRPFSKTKTMHGKLPDHIVDALKAMCRIKGWWDGA